MRKSKFKVGQVVRINVDWYKKKRKEQQYQRITGVFPWNGNKKHPFGYTFLNGDMCNEKYVAPLTAHEMAR